MSFRTVVWYFDFVSPFAYLQSSRLDGLAMHALVRCKPVLFAAILNHVGQKGPAEIPPKRSWTFEHVAWLARQCNTPLKLPREHPFNPLPLLRLALVLGPSVEVVQRLFAYVWRDGHLPDEAVHWNALLAELGVDAAALDAPEVKKALRENTDEAIAAGVFGVPTAIVEGHLFWGFDATEMIYALLNGDSFFESDALKAAQALPEGVRRI